MHDKDVRFSSLETRTEKYILEIKFQFQNFTNHISKYIYIYTHTHTKREREREREREKGLKMRE
jgi:hypothetical protein